MQSRTSESRIVTLSVAAACLSFAGAGVRAQEADNAKLETITVTADPEKGFKSKYVQIGSFRDQQLLDIPMTVNVVPRALIDAQGAQGLYDALKNTAGVARSQLGGSIYDNISIRGITVDNRTNYRLNGSLPVNNLIDMPLENKDRVEVLKGSSALYYGFTNPSGIVNMVTKRAGEQPNASVTLTGNEFGELGGHVDLGRQFGDRNQFGARLNVAKSRLRNATDGFEGDRDFGSIALDWRATQSLVLRFDAESINKDAVEQATIGVPAAVSGVITVPAVPDPTKLITGPWARYKARAQDVLARADYTFSDSWIGTFEVGRAETDRDRSFSQMLNYYTSSPILRTQVTRGQRFINRNTRAELAGRVLTGPFDHEVTFGYTENRRSQNGIGSQTFDRPQSLYDPVPLPAPVLTQTLLPNPTYISDKGLYALDRVRLGERWQVLVGLRHSNYTNKSASGLAEVSNNSPSVGAIFKPRTDTSIYATYIEGLEEGGIAPNNAINAFAVLPSAVSKQKELGLRSEAIPGVLVSAAYFRIDRASAYLNAQRLFVLDGRARYEGLELSANGEVLPQLSLYGSALFLDAKQTSASNAAMVGKTTENTAKQTISAFAEYKLPGAFTGLSVNGGAFYISRRAVNGLEQGYIPGYTLFSLGARYATKVSGHPVTLQANVDNAGDKRYWSATGTAFLAFGMPRTVKFTAKTEF